MLEVLEPISCGKFNGFPISGIPNSLFFKNTTLKKKITKKFANFAFIMGRICDCFKILQKI